MTENILYLCSAKMEIQLTIISFQCWKWFMGLDIRFVALDKDLNKVVGVAFDHKAETPGLGARISSDEIQDRYKGKEIFDIEGNLISIKMLKKKIILL